MQNQIQTDRLILRAFDRTDMDLLVTHVNDFDVARATAQLPSPYTHADAESWLSHTSEDSNSSHIYAIANLENQLMGCVSLSLADSRWELGYWLGQAHWQNGYMREAVAALLKHARSNLSQTKLYASVFDDNPRSRALLHFFEFQKLGDISVFCVARGCSVSGERLTLDLKAEENHA